MYKMKRPRSLQAKTSLKNLRAAIMPTISERNMDVDNHALTSRRPSHAPVAHGVITTSATTSTSSSSSSATLEGLPDELKICILQAMPDLDTLFTFLSCSVLYDCCYARYRLPILPAILLRELGPEVFFEARATLAAREIPVRQGEQRLQDVRDFVADYESKRSLPDVERIHAYPLDVPILLKMTALQYHIGVITYNFSRTALSIHPSTGKLDRRAYERRPPTVNETRRIQRALYRFELFVVLFRGGEYGMWYPEPYIPDAPFFDPVDITELFFAQYHPWEVAEIGCIRDFVMGTYDRIFRQCAVELEEMNEERDALMNGRRRSSASVFLKHCARKMRRKDSRSWRTIHKKEFCLSQGLAFLHTAARAQSPTEQVAVLEPYFYDWYGGLSDALSEAHDYFSFRTANDLVAELVTKPLPADKSDPFFKEALSAPAATQSASSHEGAAGSPGGGGGAGNFWDDGDEESESESDNDDDEATTNANDASSLLSHANPSSHASSKVKKSTCALPTFTSDDLSTSPNALWPLTLGFHWDRWLRHWGYVMWDRERLEDLNVVTTAPYYGRRLFEGYERRAGTMSLVWRSGRERRVSPLAGPVGGVTEIEA